MIFNEGNVKFAVICFLILCVTCSWEKRHSYHTQDQTSTRPNTLFDDPDDIQRQLDNEARDRLRFGKPKTIWILNIPTQIPVLSTLDRLHRNPRNLVTSPLRKKDVDPKLKFDNDIKKLELNKNNDLGAQSNIKTNINITEPDYNNNNDIGIGAEWNIKTNDNMIEYDINSKISDIGVESNIKTNTNILVPDSNNNNNDIGPQSIIVNDIVTRSKLNKNYEAEPKPNMINENEIEPDVKFDKDVGTDDNKGSESSPNVDSDIELGSDLYGDLEVLPEVKNEIESALDITNLVPILDEIEVDSTDSTAPADFQNDVEPELDNPGGASVGEAPDLAMPIELTSSWSYKDQAHWDSSYPHCARRSQSPVMLPAAGLIKVSGSRPLTFINYNAMPLQLTIKSDGRTVTLQGEWEDRKRPMIYGGAGNSRRYLFHSVTLHSPSEHAIGKNLFPLETQVLHVSADYVNFEDAVNGSAKDPLAFLGIVNIYKFGGETHPALKQMLSVANAASASNDELRVNVVPLSDISPPFTKYACYHGSLTTPPCTEAVLWLIRASSLPLEREVASTIKMASGNRYPQPLNDRNVFLFPNN